MALLPMQLVTVSGSSSYPAVGSPQVSLAAEPDYMVFVVEGSNDAVVIVSTDGVNDYYQLEASKPNNILKIKTKAKQLYVRSTAGMVAKLRVMFY